MEYYKIRLEWNGGKWDKTQKGAYTTKEQAIAQCTQDLIDLGYKVFSPTGEIVYPVYYHELAEQMYKDGVITDREHWSAVFNGEVDVCIDFLKTIISRYSELVNSNTKIDDANYTTLMHNGVKIYKVPTSDIKIVWHDDYKRDNDYDNCFSGGYFGNYKEGDLSFTLPVGNLVADIDEAYVNTSVMRYLKERKVENGKLEFPASKNVDSEFRNSDVSTLFITDKGFAFIGKSNTIPIFKDEKVVYAVSGVPVIVDGVKEYDYTIEGWNNSVGRATQHIFVGMTRDDSENVYFFTYNSTKSCCLKSEEIYNLVKDFGFFDLIKLDGGGSAYVKINGEVIANTSENRRINNMIVF